MLTLLASLPQPLTNIEIKSDARRFFLNFPKFGQNEFGTAKVQVKIDSTNCLSVSFKHCKTAYLI